MISFFKGWWNYFWKGLSREGTRRIGICHTCKDRKGFVCGVCGCVLVAKVESDDDCPRGLW